MKNRTVALAVQMNTGVLKAQLIAVRDAMAEVAAGAQRMSDACDTALGALDALEHPAEPAECPRCGHPVTLHAGPNLAGECRATSAGPSPFCDCPGVPLAVLPDHETPT